MPLAFSTRDRGPVAFGFFNVASDMLLLEDRFFFADAFCGAVAGIAAGDPAGPFERRVPAFAIGDPADVGDLTGAIHGVGYTGFIGETYRRHPFPARPEDFRQDPGGSVTQKEFRELIRPFAVEEALVLAGRPPDDVSVGEHRFTRDGFGELVRYVVRGGWPRWRDDSPPVCVRAMVRAVAGSRHWVFAGLDLRGGV